MQVGVFAAASAMVTNGWVFGNEAPVHSRTISKSGSAMLKATSSLLAVTIKPIGFSRTTLTYIIKGLTRQVMCDLLREALLQCSGLSN